MRDEIPPQIVKRTERTPRNIMVMLRAFKIN